MTFAVIENEFGEVGVDEKILHESVEEEVVEVMNGQWFSYLVLHCCLSSHRFTIIVHITGCICCTVRGDLVEALKKLHKKVKKFDGIIIETTGLADPAPVVQTFFIDDDIQKMYNLDSVITVVDAKHILERLAEEKP
jgi:G3E family GTPase